MEETKVKKMTVKQAIRRLYKDGDFISRGYPDPIMVEVDQHELYKTKCLFRDLREFFESNDIEVDVDAVLKAFVEKVKKMPNYKLIVGDYREEMEYGPDYD
jgi:hypothetical protein